VTFGCSLLGALKAIERVRGGDVPVVARRLAVRGTPAVQVAGVEGFESFTTCAYFQGFRASGSCCECVVVKDSRSACCD